MTFLGASILICGSCAVFVVRAFKEVLTPGKIAPPMIVFLSLTTVSVVAVPISATIKGFGYKADAATLSTSKSLPN